MRRALLFWTARLLAPALTRLTIVRTPGAPTRFPAGPLLVTANHFAHADPPLLAPLFPKAPEVAALADLWSAPVGALMRWYAPIPIHRDQVDRGALTRLLAALEGGATVLIFPEAAISQEGHLRPARDGVGYLALKTGATVLPVGIVGSPAVWPALRRGCRAPVTLVVGPLLHMPRRAAPTRAERRAATETIMQAIAALLPPPLRGPSWQPHQPSPSPVSNP